MLHKIASYTSIVSAALTMYLTTKEKKAKIKNKPKTKKSVYHRELSYADFLKYRNKRKMNKSPNILGYYVIRNVSTNKYLICESFSLFESVYRDFNGKGFKKIYKDFNAGYNFTIKLYPYNGKYLDMDELKEHIRYKHRYVTNWYI